MLVLSRKVGEEIVAPQLGLVFTILEVRGDKVKVGITAPPDVQIHRREVWTRIQANEGPFEDALPLVTAGASYRSSYNGNGVGRHH